MDKLGIETIKKHSPKKQILIKLLLIVLWGLFLLLNTWTESIEKLMYLHTFGFKWVPTPDFSSFFIFNDITLVHSEFIKVKSGHFIGFGIMDLLLFSFIKNHKYSVIIALIFAFITEFFQLFFGRDGRLYDLIIDSLGIFSVYYLTKKLSSLNKAEMKKG
ncbi:VanZ family protein [Neobacillus cucumis]|uniref:VanZ family protein n=1 Tax=Neobacillus cucumis TaxID=1740721 RepID=UPI001965B1FD|nr:VanZ family protein [Neobacillus cucumis]MBM7651837.1 putative membrane protein [Neobacillus cucumis]